TATRTKLTTTSAGAARYGVRPATIARPRIAARTAASPRARATTNAANAPWPPAHRATRRATPRARGRERPKTNTHASATGATAHANTALATTNASSAVERLPCAARTPWNANAPSAHDAHTTAAARRYLTSGALLDGGWPLPRAR